ncbi:MAG: hypothetical protein U0798_04800 [Gemmataceae bacterium]
MEPRIAPVAAVDTGAGEAAGRPSYLSASGCRIGRSSAALAVVLHLLAPANGQTG